MIFDGRGVLRSRPLIDTCDIGHGRTGFVTPSLASGVFSSSRALPPFVAHRLRQGPWRAPSNVVHVHG